MWVITARIDVKGTTRNSYLIKRISQVPPFPSAGVGQANRPITEYNGRHGSFHLLQIVSRSMLGLARVYDHHQLLNHRAWWTIAQRAVPRKGSPPITIHRAWWGSFYYFCVHLWPDIYYTHCLVHPHKYVDSFPSSNGLLDIRTSAGYYLILLL